MKPLLGSWAAIIGITISIPTHAEFTGDTKLACEALLCLSSSTQTRECQPSLNRYFSISYRKLKDTLRGRRNFLKLCPTASETPQMQKLTDDIVNAADRCNAAALNRNVREIQIRVCSNSGCIYKRRVVVINQMPAYCIAYKQNELTDIKLPKYVGNPQDTSGRWIDQ